MNKYDKFKKYRFLKLQIRTLKLEKTFSQSFLFYLKGWKEITYQTGNGHIFSIWVSIKMDNASDWKQWNRGYYFLLFIKNKRLNYIGRINCWQIQILPKLLIDKKAFDIREI